MSYRLILVCALGLVGFGCGGDGGGGGSVSELFEALNGKYLVHPDSGCEIELSGSSFHTVAPDGSHTCMEDNRANFDGIATLVVSGTFSDTRISGTLDHEITEGEGGINGTDHVTATINKVMDRMVEGRFAALAGQWEGSLSYTEQKEAVQVGEPNTTSGTHNLFIDIYGDYGTVSYEDGGELDTFEISEDSSGDIVVDGDVFQYRAP